MKLKKDIFDRINESFKGVKVSPKEWKHFYRIEGYLSAFHSSNHNTLTTSKPKQSRLAHTPQLSN